MCDIECTDVIYNLQGFEDHSCRESRFYKIRCSKWGHLAVLKGKVNNLKDGGSEGGKKWIKLRYL